MPVWRGGSAARQSGRAGRGGSAASDARVRECACGSAASLVAARPVSQRRRVTRVVSYCSLRINAALRRTPATAQALTAFTIDSVEVALTHSIISNLSSYSSIREIAARDYLPLETIPAILLNRVVLLVP